MIKEATGGAEVIAYGLTKMSFFQGSHIASGAGLAHLEVVLFGRGSRANEICQNSLSSRRAGLGDAFGSVDPLCQG